MDKDFIKILERSFENQDRKFEDLQKLHEKELEKIVDVFGTTMKKSWTQIHEEFVSVKNKLHNQDENLKTHMSRSEAVERHVKYLETKRDWSQWFIVIAFAIFSLLMTILAFK